MVNPDTRRQDSIITPLLLLVVLLGAFSRLYGLGDWAFSGDEFYTIRDAQTGNYVWPIKAGYYAILAVVLKLFGLSEWTARIPAALFGIAALPVFYLVSRPFAGRWAAWIGTVLILFSSWHLHYSQFSRFYSAVFLFGTLTYFLYYRAVETGRLRYLFAALAAGGLGVVFHTTAAIASASCAAFSIGLLLFRRKRLAQETRRVVLVHSVLTLAGALAAVPWAFAIAGEWASTGQDWGYGPWAVALQVVKYLGPTVSVAALFGTLGLWFADTRKAMFLTLSFALAALFVVVGAAFVSTRPDYVFYVVPLVFIAAASLCASIGRAMGRCGPAALGVVALIVVGSLPEFVSHYSSRRTLDPRDAIRFVERRYREGETVVDLLGDGGYYWPDRIRLGDHPGTAYREDVDWQNQLQPYLGRTDRVWVVVPARRIPFASSLVEWLSDHAALVWEERAIRYDYTYEAIQVYVTR